ncbi:MAG TPA: glycosyltransferase family 2 protein [Clostridia bacterium]|jgi:glycosyltransferase involved in cell wall biosynthesis|nr:glycosyltransferase family 2 protein [Clostridia bacterium]
MGDEVMKTAVLIPAYNEEHTIGQVLRVALICQDVNEVVVVSDGSTDQTANIARKWGAKVIDLPENRGKGAAIMAGLKATQAEIIVLLDADLVGLNPSHIRLLLEPVRRGEADMTVGVFKSGRIYTDISQRVAPFLNGQRAVKRQVLEALSHFELTRYGIDIILSRYAKNTNLKVVTIELNNLTQLMKEEKLGLFSGIAARLRMYWEIIVALKYKLPPC